MKHFQKHRPSMKWLKALVRDTFVPVCHRQTIHRLVIKLQLNHVAPRTLQSILERQFFLVI